MMVDPFGLNPKLFGSLFWNSVKNSVNPTSYKVKGAKVYEVVKKVDIPNVKKGDLFHLDTLHDGVEIELYDKFGKHKGALDGDGDMIKGPVKGRTCK